MDGEFVFFIWSNLQNAVQCCTRCSCLQSSYPQIVRYCECFAGGIYCDGCKCANCYNDVENEDVRIAAIEGILERNPSAFKPKIASSPLKTPDNRVCKWKFLSSRELLFGYWINSLCLSHFLVLFVELGGYLIDMNIVSFRSKYLSFDMLLHYYSNKVITRMLSLNSLCWKNINKNKTSFFAYLS